MDLSHLLSFVFASICTLFELAIFTNEMVNHYGFDKGSLGLEIGYFTTRKRNRNNLASNAVALFPSPRVLSLSEGGNPRRRK